MSPQGATGTRLFSPQISNIEGLESLVGKGDAYSDFDLASLMISARKTAATAGIATNVIGMQKNTAPCLAINSSRSESSKGRYPISAINTAPVRNVALLSITDCSPLF
ncbi:hypothetical protein [Leisingera aquimarina]|uniref:hypothetical protein n=1 Tax=Leisingera aquimarina TaxID=476529 RepID=UPI0012EC8749|nr:hypothetical protein [Leisingera aquimarina]